MPKININPLEQQGVGIKKEIISKQAADTNAQIFNCPSVFDPGIAKELFDQYQTYYRQCQVTDNREINTNCRAYWFFLKERSHIQ